jgi:phosphoketolase
MLNPDVLRKMDASWRAANYRSVGQIYLRSSPLLREPLSTEHIKPRLLGHRGTTPPEFHLRTSEPRHPHYRHVIGSMNPQDCRVAGFKQPSTVERAHDFFWRIEHETPKRGEIVVFNRSPYEDVHG